DGKCWAEGSAKPANTCLSCQPKLSGTKWSAANDGAACDDGILCTTADSCASGSCTSGKQTTCDDKDKCTLDACNKGTGICSSTPIIGCGGNCNKTSDCDDKNPCTDDACTNGKCAFSPTTKACDDGNACSWGDQCSAGKCVPGDKTQVSTLAGSSYGFADGAANSAKFRYPRSVAVHPSGGFVVADGHNHRIRRIDAKGKVTTLAGSSAGYVDAAGTSARFYYPSDVVVQADGHVLVADLYNHRIRKVSPAGIATTVAGSSSGYIDAVATQARFNTPHGLDVTAGGVIYVADSANHRIRRVAPNGTVTTVAGSISGYLNGIGTAARFNYPIDVRVSGDGSVIVADYNNNRIRRISTAGEVSLIAGSGTAGYVNGAGTSARFNRPWSVEELSDRSIVVVDRYNHRIRSISVSGVVGNLAGTGSSGSTDGEAIGTARFNSPWNVAVDAQGSLFVADYGSHRIRKIQRTKNACQIGGVCYAPGTVNGSNPCQICSGGSTLQSWSTVIDGSACYDGDFCSQKDNCSAGKCTGKTTSCDDGNKCSADSCDKASGACVYQAIKGCDGWCKVDADCEDGNPCVTDTCNGATASKAGTCSHSNNTLPCDDGDTCTQGDTCAGGTCAKGTAVWVSTAAGSSAGYVNGEVNKARFNQPYATAERSDGLMVVVDRYNHRIRSVSGNKVDVLAGSSAGYVNGIGTSARFNQPVDIAAAANGVLYVVDLGNQRIRKIDAKGNVTLLAGSTAGFADGKGASAKFSSPYGLDVNSAGLVYVADYNNHRVRRITPDGTVTTVTGSKSGFVDGPLATAQLTHPIDVAALPDGRWAVSEHSKHRIRLIGLDGTIALLAGAGVTGYVDGAGASARFSYPRGISWHPQGYLLVADQNNHRIRAVAIDGKVTTFAGSGAGYKDGDGNSAKLYYPRAVSTSSKGEAWISDSYNHRVRVARPTANSCLIKGACWAKGTGEAPCSLCDGSLSNKAFSPVKDGSPCTDGVLCTQGDTCASGKCGGKTAACDDKDACTKDACETISGYCTFTKIIGCNGYCETDSHCEDGNPCTLGEQCTNNKCEMGSTTYIDTRAGSGAGFKDGPASGAKFNDPVGLTANSADQVFVADRYNHRIRRVSTDGSVITFAGSGKAGLVDGVGAKAWFNQPADLATASDGTIWIVDRYTHSVRKMDTNAKVTTVAGNGASGYNDDFGSSASFNQPTGIDVAPSGMIFVADCYNNRIRRVEPDGTTHTLSGLSKGFKDGDVAVAKFNRPTDVAVGADAMVFVADYGNHRIRRVTPDGTVITIAGSGKSGSLNGAVTTAQFSYPRNLVIDSAQRIFVADYYNNRVRRITGKLVETLIGSSSGYIDGASDVARLSKPSALALTAGGTLYVSGTGNDRVRRIRVTGSACQIGGVCYAQGIRNSQKPCESCQGAKAAKAWSSVTDGAVCDDGNQCSIGDSCSKGSCQGGTSKLCNDNNGCTKDTCDSKTGECAYKPTFDPNCKP
ncbi:MAG TPA: hypothetical protein DCQ06_14005, partial [Myxococcales bacterium]|nr:hypothetical protein [Myxococcales bacterium]